MSRVNWAKVRLFTTMGVLSVVIVSGLVFNARQNNDKAEATASTLDQFRNQKTSGSSKGKVAGVSTTVENPSYTPTPAAPNTTLVVNDAKFAALSNIVTTASVDTPVTPEAQAQAPVENIPAPIPEAQAPSVPAQPTEPVPPATTPATVPTPPPIVTAPNPATEAISVPVGGNSPSYTLSTADGSGVLWRSFNEGVNTSNDETLVKSGFAMFIVIDSPYNPLVATPSVTFHIHARSTALVGTNYNNDALLRLGLASYSTADSLVPLQSYILHATVVAATAVPVVTKL